MTTENSKFSSSDVEIVASEAVYKGFFKMVRYQLRHRLFAGGWSEVMSREVFERGHAVVVLPYDPVLDEVVLIEQFRIGAMATTDSPWLLECVAGIIDAGETQKQVCYRETKEEANLEILDLKPITSYLASPGGTTERLYIYLAKVDATKARGIHGLDNENEDIRVHRFSSTEAFQLLESGKLDNAATLIAMQWLKIHLAELRGNW